MCKIHPSTHPPIHPSNRRPLPTARGVRQRRGDKRWTKKYQKDRKQKKGARGKRKKQTQKQDMEESKLQAHEEEKEARGKTKK